MKYDYVELGEIAEVTKLAGFEFTKYISYNESGEIIALRALNLRNGQLDLSDIKRIDRSISDLLPRSKLYIGDILLTYTGNGYGDCAIIMENDKYHLAPNICKITAKNNIVTPYFLYSYIRSREFYKQMSNHMVGSSQPTIPMKTIRQLKIPLPPVDDQKRIGSIISAIDDKIALNQQINNNLLEQLNQLFAEFSTRCKWNYLSIGEIAEKVAMGPFGSNIKVSTFVESGVPIISGNHLRGYFLEEPSYNYITEAHAEKLKNSIVYPKDIIFTHAGNIGQVAMIPDGCEYPFYVISQRQFYLRCNTSVVAPEYVLLFFHSRNGQYELLSYANQTGVPSIAQPASNLKKICLPIPPISEQEKWFSVVKPIIAMYQNYSQQIKRLSILRDTLLPRLISGELDVSDIEF